MTALSRPAIDGLQARWFALAAAAIGHGAVIAGMLAVPVRPASIVAPQVLMVSVETQAAPAAPSVPPEPQPPHKPKHEQAHIKPPIPVKAEPEPAPAHQPAEAATPPAAVTMATPPSSPAGVAAAAASPVVAPRFDADYLSNPAPAYPSASRAMGEQGKVLLRVLVSPQGGSEQVTLHNGSGFERLDLAALQAVRRWQFVPARQGDEAVAAWVIVPISFTLRR
jgi:periplasmic protein TonB